MPITSSNELPHVSFLFSHQPDAASISCLYDTGGLLNTGNLALHLHIYKCVPTAVADFEQFGLLTRLSCLVLSSTRPTIILLSMVFFWELSVIIHHTLQ